jgi:membrane protein implicated in regulation of membrane protease activity
MESIIGFFAAEPGWVWLIIAAALFTLDVLAPGFFMLWFGGAAAAVGVLVFAVPFDATWQIVAFCVASLISLMIARMLWGGKRGEISDKPLLNERARQLVGRTFVLATPIRGGRGRVIAGDGMWSVRGPELPEGALVRETGADGTEHVFEAVD